MIRIKRKLSDITKQKISQSLKGRKFSEEHKQKLREAILSRGFPNYNPSACKIIDEYGKNHGYNFRHALNGGEFQIIGYSLDGYDRDKNIVIEYYEKRHHSSESEIQRDAIRKRRIVKHLKCEFIELRETDIS